MEVIRRNRMRKTLNYDAVTAFAALNIMTDQGVPISPAPHHKLWLRLACDSDIKRLLIIGSPESAKTSWMMAYAACFVGFFPEKSVIITSISDDVAEQRSLMIRNLTETESWKKLFPLATRDNKLKYEQAEWSLGSAGRLHPTMRSYGMGSSIVGSRADLIVADDILDFDSTRTQHQRMLTESWFHNSLLSRMKPEGRAIVIGTSWSSSDLYNKLSTEDKGWVVCRTGILSNQEDGFYANLLYPDGFTGHILGEPV
jgi:hypothetical protein